MKNESQQMKQNSSSHSTIGMESHLNQDSEKNAQSKSTCERSPLAEADKIVNQSRETRDKEYGGFTASMKRTAAIASELCNKEITTDDAFKMLMALKLSRLSYSPDHFDSYTDLMGYAEGWWKYREENNRIKVDFAEAEKNVIQNLQEIETRWDRLKNISQKILDLEAEGYRVFGPKAKIPTYNAPIQAMNGAQTFLENLAKTLTSHGYRVFPPEGGHSFTESMDWKDQQQ